MKILFLSSEATGLIKTGGLADVARALPLALRQKGHDVRLVLPNYLSIARTKNYSTAVSSLGVPMGNSELFCAVQQTELEQLPVYLVEYNDFFLRSHPYEDMAGNPHPDNGERFGFFCKAALQLCLADNFIPDIIHANDWQGALACLYLHQYRSTYPEFAKTRSLLTIHNGGYQGHCPASARSFLEIGDHWFHPAGFEDHGQINLLKGGLRTADQLNAVSVGYAEELKTSLGGHGLHESYEARKEVFSGILNGCEYEVWNPATDPYLTTNYDLGNLSGKIECKSALQAEMGLPEAPEVPLIGIVSRLTGQKGFDFSLPAIAKVLSEKVQFAILGSGERWIVEEIVRLSEMNPEKLQFHDGYSEPLAHRIEAGSDFFLMPSLYEPCGLNQMYSLRYGTLPIVRAVGGLRDTVWEENTSGEDGTGFVFAEPTAEHTLAAIKRGIDCFTNDRASFQSRMNLGMRQRFSWENTATQYENIYAKALKTSIN